MAGADVSCGFGGSWPCGIILSSMSQFVMPKHKIQYQGQNLMLGVGQHGHDVIQASIQNVVVTHRPLLHECSKGDEGNKNQAVL
jgi:hypothetical protein